MKLRYLPLIPQTGEEFRFIETKLQKWLLENLYRKLLLDPSPLQNTIRNDIISDLVSAIRLGRIVFSSGKFTGNFSAAITRGLKEIGAKWRSGAFHIRQVDLPPEVAHAAHASRARLEKEVDRIEQRLSEIVMGPLNIQDAIDKTLWTFEKDVQKSTKDIVVVPELTPEQVASISADYVKSLELPIKGWAEKEVVRLRKIVRKRVLEGQRGDALAEILRKSYGLAKSKAKFIARQETKLMQTTFLQSRYQKAGLDEYHWQSVVGTKAHPVRPRHKELNDMSARGHTFRYSQPPRSSENGQPARFNNPGEDYNCRCRARVLVKF